MPRQLPPIDDDIFEELQRLAVPLVDDVNSVLRRVLGLDPRMKPELPIPASAGQTTSGPRARGRTLPDSEYEGPLLQALHEAGGQAPASRVVERIGELLQDRLKQVDYEELKSGGPRWKNRVQFARLRLVRSGHLSSDSPRGVWELTDFGKRVAAAAAEQDQPDD